MNSVQQDRSPGFRSEFQYQNYEMLLPLPTQDQKLDGQHQQMKEAKAGKECGGYKVQATRGGLKEEEKGIELGEVEEKSWRCRCQDRWRHLRP
jgi:hypothetical protein